MNQELVHRFKEAYKRIYGINPEVVWVGKHYRSPHLPMSMTARSLRSHCIRLEGRIADTFEED